MGTSFKAAATKENSAAEDPVSLPFVRSAHLEWAIPVLAQAEEQGTLGLQGTAGS